MIWENAMLSETNQAVYTSVNNMIPFGNIYTCSVHVMERLYSEMPQVTAGETGM